MAIIGVYEFTHDLARLLRGLQEAGLEVPEELIVYADALTPHYTMARYPGRKPVVYDEDAGRRCVEYARRLWEWAENWPKILKSMRPSDEDLMLFVERVRERYPHSTILLFGSRARGDNLPYSDYDVAVILERVEDRLREAEELAKLKPSRLPLDLVVLEPGDLQDPLIAKMLTPCKVLYDGLGLGEALCRQEHGKR